MDCLVFPSFQEGSGSVSAAIEPLQISMAMVKADKKNNKLRAFMIISLSGTIVVGKAGIRKALILCNFSQADLKNGDSRFFSV